MRIVFMGTPEFAVASLAALKNAGHEICAVVTVPDKARGRGLKVQPSAVKQYALAQKLPVLQPASLKDVAFEEQLKALQAELFVVVAFKILPQAIFSIPKHGTINLHGSLLPAYRGAAPINWAIINGDNESGVTTIFIDKKVDTGNIILKEHVAINEDMNAGQLHDTLMEVGAGLLIKTVTALQSGNITAQIQDETLASKAPKLTNANTQVDFSLPVKKVYNLVRGLAPFPGAYTWLDGKKMKILAAEYEEVNHGLEAGTIDTTHARTLKIACDGGFLTINVLQLAGKRRMESHDFINGYPIKKAKISFKKQN